MTNSFDRLRPHLCTEKKIRVERNRPSNQLLNGYLMGLSDTLGLMHCFDDFEPDGYTVFRVCDVTNIRSSAYERHWDRMLAEEGLLDGLRMVFDIRLEDMRTAIQSIDEQFQTMIVECEDEEDDIQDFYIGQLVSVNEPEIAFAHFDGLGCWEEGLATIMPDEITLIQFDTPYIQIFSKYLSGAPSVSPRDIDA
ncbi:MAG: hypothetical protein KDA52_22675 [Planctomycetaceae bacterium]|nr:hypothetical protein [Planctomycetaceae bacterium]